MQCIAYGAVCHYGTVYYVLIWYSRVWAVLLWYMEKEQDYSYKHKLSYIDTNRTILEPYWIIPRTIPRILLEPIPRTHTRTILDPYLESYLTRHR